MEHYLVTLSAGYEWLTFPQNASYLEYPKCLYKLAKQNSAKLRITVSVTLFQHMDDIVPILSKVKTVVVLVVAFSAQAPQHKDRSAKHLPPAVSPTMPPSPTARRSRVYLRAACSNSRELTHKTIKLFSYDAS